MLRYCDPVTLQGFQSVTSGRQSPKSLGRLEKGEDILGAQKVPSSSFGAVDLTGVQGQN